MPVIVTDDTRRDAAHRLTPAWKQMRPHAVQSALWRTRKRFVAVAAGRGSGKTDLSRKKIIKEMRVDRGRVANFFFALPTYPQAKKVAWGELLSLIPREWGCRANGSEMTITTPWRSTLYVVGMDKPERIEGVQYDGGVIDESSDQRPGTFTKSVRPALTHRSGWCWRIGVPKRTGIGAKEFKRFCFSGSEHWSNAGLKENPKGNPDVAYFTWTSEDIISEEEIASSKRLLDKKDYAEQYLASWENATGGIFHAMSTRNISTEAVYHRNLPIVVGSDFNVDPMAWTLSHRIGGELHTFDEVWLRNTNTQSTLTYLYERYGSHEAGWNFFGDAAGRQRRTSASSTDYLLIKNDKRFKYAQVFYPLANPRVVDRFAACNALLCNAADEVRALINPRCEHLIADLEQRSYKEGTREADDRGDVGHISDAWGYVVHMLFPVKLDTAEDDGGEIFLGDG